MPSELVEPVVQLFGRYGVSPPVVEEPGGFNPDDDEGPSPGAAQVRTYLPVNRRLNWRRSRLEVGIRLLSLIQPIPPMESRTIEPPRLGGGLEGLLHPPPRGPEAGGLPVVDGVRREGR